MTANASTGFSTKDSYSKEKPALNTCLLGGIILLMSVAACDSGIGKLNLKQFKRLYSPPCSTKARKNTVIEKIFIQRSDVRVQLCRH